MDSDFYNSEMECRKSRKEMNYRFIPFDKMNGLVDVKVISSTEDLIQDFFLYEKSEVAYIVDQDRNLEGIITPTDLDRYI